MKKILSVLILICIYQNILAQYTLNGNASQDACNAYTLTQDAFNQSGSVWNNNKINLTQSFDFNFDVNLGNHDTDGADGIVFVLQPISTSVGTVGGGLGYQGITPAVGVSIDTWQNSINNDPSFDHIAIQLNGDLNHQDNNNNIAGPVTALSTNDNIEDGLWHSLRIVWDAPTTTYTAYIDGILRVTVVKDFVKDVFGGDPLVFWGFTGSTGGAKNHQQFRTALNPSFHLNVSQTRCINQPIIFIDSTVSFTNIAKFYWDFGDGSPIDSINLNPVHIYNIANDYIVNQRVVGADGCEATNSQTVRVGSIPKAAFKTDDNCVLNTINFTDTSFTQVGTINNWFWDFADGTTSTLQNPTDVYFTRGNKNIQLTVTTIEGCVSNTLVKPILIYSRPNPSFRFTDSVCIGNPTFFVDNSTPNGDPITNRIWTFADTTGNITTANAAHVFINPGVQAVVLAVSATGNTGCYNIIQKNVYVVNKPVANFKTNAVCKNAITFFFDSSYTSDGTLVNKWRWNLGNGTFATIPNPSTNFGNSSLDTVTLVVTNSKGCKSDTLKQPIVINPKPIANFGYSTPLCEATSIQFSDSSAVSGSTINNWQWIYNNATWSNLQNTNKAFASGNQLINLVSTSVAGCKSDTAKKIIFISGLPNVTLNFKNGCNNTKIPFSATDNSGSVTKWTWFFGDGEMANSKDTVHKYLNNGTYTVSLIAEAISGCYADSLNKDIIIYGTNAFAGNDTIAASGQPIQLHASGGLSYIWSPASNLNSDTIANPITIITATQFYYLKAFTPEGCESYDTVKVSIYKGPDIYLPNAFTPNGDGLNDIFKCTPVGLKQFNYLTIYNRWGQQIFYTTDYNIGWNGFWKDQKQPSGTYIVIASGVDTAGNLINKKATVLLVR